MKIACMQELSSSFLFLYSEFRLDRRIPAIFVGNGGDCPGTWKGKQVRDEVVINLFANVRVPSRAEKIEYSWVITRETVCVSRTRPGFPPFLGVGSDRWYVNVNGGSPISVKTISAWSPAHINSASSLRNP
jgi:hypothetical protein